MRAKLCTSALIVLACVVVASGAALADEYAVGPPDSGRRPDNSEHTYCWGSGFTTTNAHDASRYAMGNLDSQTTMFDNFINGGCSSITDARWIKTTDNVDGYYQCLDFNSAGECETAHVALNFGNMGSWADWKQTACHETGHSVGLTHGNFDCMSTDSSKQHYSDHHRGHVNNDR
jgi:hypothetical protein